MKKSISYIISDDYVGNFAFKTIPSHKKTIEELESRLKKGSELLGVLGGNSYISYYKTVDNKKLHIAYLLQNSPIYTDAEILFCIVFDENQFMRDILYLKLVSFLFLLLEQLLYILLIN